MLEIKIILCVMTVLSPHFACISPLEEGDWEVAYRLHISFISSVDMESASSGIHGAEGLEAVQGFIQDSIAGTSPNAHANTLYFVHVHPTNSYMIVST